MKAVGVRSVHTRKRYRPGLCVVLARCHPEAMLCRMPAECESVFFANLIAISEDLTRCCINPETQFCLVNSGSVQCAV